MHTGRVPDAEYKRRRIQEKEEWGMSMIDHKMTFSTKKVHQYKEIIAIKHHRFTF